MTTLPALSTPCTWNTFLARSTPMVLICMWTTPSGDSLLNDHPLAHLMPGAGVVHDIIRVGLGPCWSFPVFPKQQTSSDRPSMSQTCQTRKSPLHSMTSSACARNGLSIAASVLDYPQSACAPLRSGHWRVVAAV